MPRRSLLSLSLPQLLLLVATPSFLFACSRDRVPDTLVVYPAPVGSYNSDKDLSFAVGLRTELHVSGSLGMDHDITSARCFDGSCRVEEITNLRPTARTSTYLVTPLAPTFHIHIELIADAGPTTIDKELTALDGGMGALHRGAGPGVPFIVGTTITWYIGPRARHITWDPSLSTISVRPPFELATEPQVGGGPDNQTFVGVHVRATAAGTGTLTHMNGDATTTFPLVAVGRDEIKKLHVAPAPEMPQMDDKQALSSIAADRISVTGYQTAWIVFETASGAFGVAGAGESLPSPGAVFDIYPYDDAFYSFGISLSNDEPHGLPREDQPFLKLQSLRRGTSKLLLRAGDMTGSADVDVVE